VWHDNDPPPGPGTPAMNRFGCRLWRMGEAKTPDFEKVSSSAARAYTYPAATPPPTLRSLAL
jgi:hypothetical protein